MYVADVPLVVIGEFATANSTGMAKPTLDTVPLVRFSTYHVPSPRKNVEAVAVPVPRRAVLNTPVVILDASSTGMSVAVSARKLGVPELFAGDAST